MKKYKIPILTEEYKIIVYLGTKQELIKSGAKYLEKTEKELEEYLLNKRGISFNSLASGLGKSPIILVDADYPADTAISTIAHETSHAMDSIQDYLGINDISGEVHAHGISSVMRHVLKDILIDKKKKKVNR